MYGISILELASVAEQTNLSLSRSHTDGRTNTVFRGRSLSTGRAMKVNPSGENSIWCQTLTVSLSVDMTVSFNDGI